MTLDVLQGIFSLDNLLMMNIGLAAGIMIGALPGLNVNFAITVLLPLTFEMSSTSGVLMLLGAYCGAMYGGSITAVLINTPGTPAAVATSFDGYPLACKGRAGDALKTALFGSFFGGLFSAICLLLFAPQIAKIILHIGSPEYFALCVFGLCAAVGLAGKNILKGVITATAGLLLATVGLDAFQGTQRYVFGSTQLMAGLKPVIVMLGMYALSEVLIKSRELYQNIYGTVNRVVYRKATIKTRELLGYWKTLIKSSVFGVVIGAAPGTGGAISAMFSYSEARRTSKQPEEFGQGSIEGVLAPETGNNAVTGATLIPLLTFGIPGDNAMAVLMGALTMQGITVGPMLFTGQNLWVYIIMVGLVLVNIFMLIQGSLFIRAFTRVTQVPVILLLPIITILVVMGSFSINNSSFDVMLMVVFGMLGFLMKRLDFPLPPMTIGLVLGTLMEKNLRRSLLLSDGDYSIFFSNPVSCAILVLSALCLFFPYVKKTFGKLKHAK